MASVLLSINCFNRFHDGRYFPKWWEHIEAMVIKPYRDILDVALYDDGSTDRGMIDYLTGLKSSGRIDWLTLGLDRNASLPFARHAFGNAGYAYSLSGWPEHEFVLHFDTDIWFVRPELDKGFDWLRTSINRLRGSPATFATSLWGCLWGNSITYRGKPPSWFHLGGNDPVWVRSGFFSTRMFLARADDLARNSRPALSEVGRRGKTRGNRSGLVGKIDSYERIVNKNELYAKGRHVDILRPKKFGVVTRHIDGFNHPFVTWIGLNHSLIWAEEHLGIRSECKLDSDQTLLWNKCLGKHRRKRRPRLSRRQRRGRRKG